MTVFFARHRATLGLVSVIVLPAFFALPAEWPASESGYWISRTIPALLWVACGAAIWSSPYWKIIYREAPLRRALTGVSDLDERELALRDRANGLTYYLFLVANLLLLLGGGIAADAGWIALSGDTLTGGIMPYAYFAITLPVIMLEWFEPSGPAAEPLEDEQ